MSNSYNAPQSPNEAILQNILGESNELREPQSRIETLLIALLEKSAPVAPTESGDYKLHIGDDGVASWVKIT